MKLTSFQVTNYRSINDSSTVRVQERTALVGRNESGKSSLLRVLASLKPPGKPPVFTLTRDFPRDRKRTEFKDSLPILETSWELSAVDQAKFAKLYPRAAGATSVTVERDYAARRSWNFQEALLADIAAPALDAFRTAEQAVVTLETRVPGVNLKASPALDALRTAIFAQPNDAAWGTAVLTSLAALRSALTATGVASEDAFAGSLSAIERIGTTVAQDDALWTAAETWLVGQIPMFVYLDEWEEVPGHYLMSQYLSRVQAGQATNSDLMFTKLLKVADLDASQLQTLAAAQHEERRLLTDRASRVFTRTIKTFWTDREITVDFAVDGDHLDVLVKDADTDALVSLDERSRGFR